MSNHKEASLVLAAWHVARGRMIVARQRERIARLRAFGYSTLDAEQTLRVFASTLDIFVDHERWLRDDTPRALDDGSASSGEIVR
jgi:hypothetical protein